MGFINPNEVGILEKAAKIAVKFNVIYSPRDKVFLGRTDNVQKATVALSEWQSAQDDRLRHERRQETW